MSDEPAAKRKVHLNTDEQADIVTLLHESLDNAKYPIEDHANKTVDNDGGQKRKQTKEACKACRLSRTRCDNDGIKTVCKRCSRLGLQCVYKDQVAELHVSYGVGSPSTSVGQLIGEYGQTPKLARSPKLSACEECKIRKTKCEDSPISNTCKECKRKGIPCIRTRYSRGRPLANYTKELLLTKASSAPIDFFKFPRVLAPFRTEQTRDVLICLSEWLDAHYIYLRQNEGSLALLFNALSCVFEQTVPEYVQDILLLKNRFSTTIDPSVYEGPSYYHTGAATSSGYQAQPGSSVYSASSVATTFDPSISGPSSSGVGFLRFPLDDSIAGIRMEAISGHVNFAVSSKFIELFCEEKHINGQLHVSLARHWWEYITAQNLGMLLEATLSHFVYSPNDDLQLPLIANVVYSKSNEYIHNHIILADKKGDKYSCVPTVACSVEDYGRSVVVMVSLRELRLSSSLDYNVGSKKKKSKLAGDTSAK